MKNLFAICFLAASAVTMPPTTPTTPTTTQEKPKEAPRTPTPPPQSPRPKLIIPPSTTRTPRSQGATTGDLFYFPGVIGRGDNFVNISKSIPVQVNFIKAESVELPFKQESLQALIAQIFEKGGLTTSSSTSHPLPFFNLIVLILPTTNGFAASCQGRLFEKVNLTRVNFKEEVFQAITWEQSNLIFAPMEDFERMLTSTIEGIANNFVTRLNAQNPSQTGFREGRQINTPLSQ